MGLEFGIFVTMKNVADDEKTSKIINLLKNDNVFKIYKKKINKNHIKIESFDSLLYDNCDNAIRMLSIEYPNDIICYEKNANCTNVFSYIESISYNNLYMKNGINILKYDHRYRPVYSEDLDKNFKFELNLDEFEKEIEEKKQKSELSDYNFLNSRHIFELPTGHELYFKKPLQRYYKIIEGDINQEIRISYDEFVSYFDKSEIDIFKDAFEACDNINNDDIETGFNDENDKYFIKGLKLSTNFNEFIEKYCR